MAEAADQRTAWYYALHALISSSGKDVASEEKPSPTAAGAMAHHFHYEKPVEPDYQKATAVLKQGGQFTRHILEGSTDRRTQAVYVWYDEREGDMGAICTGAVRGVEEKEEKGAEAVKPRVEELWRLEDIRDLFLGTRNFRKSGGASVPHDSVCMSIVLLDKAEAQPGGPV